MSSQIGTAVMASAITISAKRSQGVPRIGLYRRPSSFSGALRTARIDLRTGKAAAIRKKLAPATRNASPLH